MEELATGGIAKGSQKGVSTTEPQTGHPGMKDLRTVKRQLVRGACQILVTIANLNTAADGA